MGPQHSYLKGIGRVEGIIPALESAHAVHSACKLAKELGPGKIVVICLSGRGDKDCEEVRRLLKM